MPNWLMFRKLFYQSSLASEHQLGFCDLIAVIKIYLFYEMFLTAVVYRKR